MAWVAPVIGIGSALLGFGTGQTQMSNQKAATDQEIAASRMGYDYLSNNPLVQQSQQWGSQAGTNLNAGIGQFGALLGMGGDQAAADKAFADYQNSTGYQFRLGQGMNALTGSAAAKGLLNSGATAKALTSYGQNLGSQEFSNYLGQFGNYLGSLQNQMNTGLNSAYNVGQAGSSAGNSIAQVTQNGVDAQNQYLQNQNEGIAGGLSTALNGLSSLWG